MKTNLLSFFIAATLIGFASCKKEDSPTSPGNPNSKLVRIQQGIDADLSNDTVILVNYNSAGKISSLIDSIYGYIVTASYDETGKLQSINDDYGDDASFTYDANGQLTAINFIIAGTKEKYLFEYSNGVVGKMKHYSDHGSGGAQTLWREYHYTVQNENIVAIYEYTASSVLVGIKEFTYSTQPNNFKQLSLFNTANRLGSERIISIDSYFNKNMAKTISADNSTITNTYTLNASQQLSKAVSNEDGGYIFTWLFKYE